MQRVHLEYLGDSVELPIGETVIGRDLSCALRFNDPAVSRKHLRFIRRQDEVFLEDLGSSNGTLLNGRSVAAALRITDGDEVRVGSRLLTIRIIEGEDEPAASTLVLKNFNAPEELKKLRAATSQVAVTVPPPMSANQRCPRCAAPVNLEDDECATCKFRWADFRPMTPTDVRPNPLNRRRHDRKPIELSLVYSSSELEIEATSRDLSESGVFVCSQVLDPIGTECQLTILVDGGPPISVRGVVRRVVERETADGEPIGIGVEFVRIAESDRAWIRTVVSRMMQEVDDENTQPVDVR
ncbi:MAG TPA: FHA domain-containing protein [Kofleriaceae bacterium]|nr:FHA domain-containing protein [Kofleriaceae bacterium]